MLARIDPDLPCTALLGQEEWQALYCNIQRVPEPAATPPTRGWLYQREECDFDSPTFWRSVGEFYWRGYFVSTVGLDKETVRAYIRNQEKEDDRYDQMKLGL